MSAICEWLVTNGLGGYASGTVGGIPTRRYHGLLVAALPNPVGRTMMLGALVETVKLADGRRFALGGFADESPDAPHLAVVEFRLDRGLPVWRFAGDDAAVVIERRIVMAYGLNTTVASYRVVAGGPVRLGLRPALQIRGHDDPVSTSVPSYPLRIVGDRVEVVAPEPVPPLRLLVDGNGGRTSFVVEPRAIPDVAYQVEHGRGYAWRGELYSPGRFRAVLAPDHDVAFVASTEPWETITALAPAAIVAAEHERRDRLVRDVPEPARQLVYAADQFLIRPAGRRDDRIRAQLAGDEAWSVIAGYHWFTDWGRDTMISLDGLALATGRHREAAAILRMFAHHLRDGLVPNLFPEGADDGVYHTADATLWLFHAIDRYVRVTGDRALLAELLPRLRDVVAHHVAGTRFGIHVDPADGLLAQGAPGYALTWMDAKCGDWVVTPRRGKPVEVNALWFNALRLMAAWDDAAGHAALADRVAESFERRFWNPATGHLFDLVDGEAGDDPACRPNQLFAISLPNPVLARAHWPAVLEAVERELVTPVGLRSLSPKHADFRASYRGDVHARDAAYHQGTVWSWLIGPYVDALLKIRPDDVAAAHRAIAGLRAHLDDGCIGQVGEVFDAEPPFTPGGCVAQAWGVAELLRCVLRVGTGGA